MSLATRSHVGVFQEYRPLLFSIAYRMLGSADESDDVLQDAYLRFQAEPLDAVRSPKAFLSTIVTRLCLNQLKPQCGWPIHPGRVRTLHSSRGHLWRRRCEWTAHDPRTQP